MFRTNQKFIYTFLEIFEKSKKMLVFGFSDNYNFLKAADPRIISRFPKKTYLFEKTDYFAFKEWFHEATKQGNSKKLREMVNEDKTFTCMLETAQMLGTSFKDFEKTVKRYFTDLLWFVTVTLKDKAEENGIDLELQGEESDDQESNEEEENQELEEEESYGYNLRSKGKLEEIQTLRLKTKPNRQNCVNYVPAPSDELTIIKAMTKLVDKKRKIYKSAQKCHDSFIGHKQTAEIKKAVSGSYVVNVASKVHKIYKRLKECHLLVLIGFFEAKNKYGSRISFENIYLRYCGHLAEDKLVKQDSIVVSLYLKEMVAMDLLVQFEERGNTYYDIQGSIHYLGNIYQNIANDSQINFSIKEKLKRVMF